MRRLRLTSWGTAIFINGAVLPGNALAGRMFWIGLNTVALVVSVDCFLSAIAEKDPTQIKEQYSDFH